MGNRSLDSSLSELEDSSCRHPGNLGVVRLRTIVTPSSIPLGGHPVSTHGSESVDQAYQGRKHPNIYDRSKTGCYGDLDTP